VLDLTRTRGLYAIVDPTSCSGRDPIDVTRAILAGGCALLQLRAKLLAGAELEKLALRVAELCRCAAVPFIINDWPELALRVRADGVHLGQSDLSVTEARRRLGPSRIIGLSTHDAAQAAEAQRKGADIIGFGPVYPTRTKHNPDPAVGLQALRDVCARVAVPVVAIGGINADNASEVASCGPNFGAAISALCAARDPAAIAQRLHAAFSAPRPDSTSV
jgi:thiamine-phosphate pyrophosphorylase